MEELTSADFEELEMLGADYVEAQSAAAATSADLRNSALRVLRTRAVSMYRVAQITGVSQETIRKWRKKDEQR